MKSHACEHDSIVWKSDRVVLPARCDDKSFPSVLWRVVENHGGPRCSPPSNAPLYRTDTLQMDRWESRSTHAQCGERPRVCSGRCSFSAQGVSINFREIDAISLVYTHRETPWLPVNKKTRVHTPMLRVEHHRERIVKSLNAGRGRWRWYIQIYAQGTRVLETRFHRIH